MVRACVHGEGGFPGRFKDQQWSGQGCVKAPYGLTREKKRGVRTFLALIGLF